MSIQEQSLRGKIRGFIELNMNVDDEAVLNDSDNIFGLGYVSSIFAMRLLNFIENLSGITVADDEIALANFCSIDAMAALVCRHQGAL